jgi:hypothetical protein
LGRSGRSRIARVAELIEFCELAGYTVIEEESGHTEVKKNAGPVSRPIKADQTITLPEAGLSQAFVLMQNYKRRIKP